MKAKRYQPMPKERIPSKLEAAFISTWRLVVAGQLPEPWPEHCFDPVRKWRFDFAWPHVKVAVELEGAQWTGGRHTRGSGMQLDCEKYNAAAKAGWCVLRYTTKDMETRPVQCVEEVVETILE